MRHRALVVPFPVRFNVFANCSRPTIPERYLLWCTVARQRAFGLACPRRIRYGLPDIRQHNREIRGLCQSRETLTITDNRTGKTYEVPITHDTIRAMDLRQIKVDSADFGMMSYDPAFNNTASCISKVTYIDGDAGILRYRGYPIEDLAEKSTYLETAYLLLHGELPTARPVEGLDLPRHASHLYSRKHQEISRWLSLRRPSHGHDDFDDRGAFDLSITTPKISSARNRARSRLIG